MAKLEDLQRGALVTGVLPDEPVTVVNVKWIGTEALEAFYKTQEGATLEILKFSQCHSPPEPFLGIWESSHYATACCGQKANAEVLSSLNAALGIAFAARSGRNLRMD